MRTCVGDLRFQTPGPMPIDIQSARVARPIPFSVCCPEKELRLLIHSVDGIPHPCSEIQLYFYFTFYFFVSIFPIISEPSRKGCRRNASSTAWALQPGSDGAHGAERAGGRAAGGHCPTSGRWETRGGRERRGCIPFFEVSNRSRSFPPPD